MPSAAERQGDLSELGLDIFDPASGATPAERVQFQGNRIPAGRLSPQARNLLQQIPLPNINGAVRDQPNYAGSGTIRFNEDLVNTRWDYYLSGNTQVFGRYSLADYRMDLEPADAIRSCGTRSRPPIHALPIRMPAANTSAPPTTTWRAARRNGVSMNRFCTHAIAHSSTNTTAIAMIVAVRK